MRSYSIAAPIALAAMLAGPAIAQPQPQTTPTTTPTAQPLRVGFNTCADARLYTWPDPSSLPSTAHLLPSHPGEQFEIVRGPVYTLEGTGFYETTVPVVWGTGSGAHYWISDRCINPTVKK